MVIEGVINGKMKSPLIIVGDINNHYGRFLSAKYSSEKVKFIGSIFDKNELNSLRYYSFLYFHGHSVGGTNPSLLEAMASSCVICAHDNKFNRAVLGENGYYFCNSHDISELLKKANGEVTDEKRKIYIQNNLNRISKKYDPERIINKYYRLV
jgi:glycosyltransferase involved in cell wall biosynthesis